MSNIITQESFESLSSLWADPDHSLRWELVFVLPLWLKVWWQELKPGGELYLGAVREGGQVIGVAPLLMREGRASIIGSADVCDYLDFVVAPGREREFFNVLLDDLKQIGVSHLDLSPLRPDSTVLTDLVGIAKERGYGVDCRPEQVSLELDLPSTWEEYLALLSTKQRHEVRRKLRKLLGAGKVDYYFVKDNAAVDSGMDVFLKMFCESRQDKATFLTGRREAFFRVLAEAMAEAGLLKLGILELDSSSVAMIMCFDYNDCIYLYNSGYSPQYSSLSVGLLCKVLGIKESIQEGKRRFDFLRGDETYKYQLGGREVPLYQCQITIK